MSFLSRRPAPRISYLCTDGTLHTTEITAISHENVLIEEARCRQIAHDVKETISPHVQRLIMQYCHHAVKVDEAIPFLELPDPEAAGKKEEPTR